MSREMLADVAVVIEEKFCVRQRRTDWFLDVYARRLGDLLRQTYGFIESLRCTLGRPK